MLICGFCRYVRVSRDRFDDVSFSAVGIRAVLSGSAGEETAVTALQPVHGGGDWLVQTKTVRFTGPKATVTFSV